VYVKDAECPSTGINWVRIGGIPASRQQPKPSFATLLQLFYPAMTTPPQSGATLFTGEREKLVSPAHEIRSGGERK
jgi:hypothetical protein